MVTRGQRQEEDEDYEEDEGDEGEDEGETQSDDSGEEEEEAGGRAALALCDRAEVGTTWSMLGHGTVFKFNNITLEHVWLFQGIKRLKATSHSV